MIEIPGRWSSAICISVTRGPWAASQGNGGEGRGRRCRERACEAGSRVCHPFFGRSALKAVQHQRGVFQSESWPTRALPAVTNPRLKTPPAHRAAPKPTGPHPLRLGPQLRVRAVEDGHVELEALRAGPGHGPGASAYQAPIKPCRAAAHVQQPSEAEPNVRCEKQKSLREARPTLRPRAHLDLRLVWHAKDAARNKQPPVDAVP